MILKSLKLFFFSALFLVSLGIMSCTQKSKKSKKPNIIFLFADDQNTFVVQVDNNCEESRRSDNVCCGEKSVSYELVQGGDIKEDGNTISCVE